MQTTASTSFQMTNRFQIGMVEITRPF